MSCFQASDAWWMVSPNEVEDTREEYGQIIAIFAANIIPISVRYRKAKYVLFSK